MNKRYLFFYLGVSFWLIALTACLSYSTVPTMVWAVLALGAFTLHCSQSQVLKMFNKNKKTCNDLLEKKSNIPTGISSDEKSPHTIIAKDICVEGNLTSSGKIEVFGEVKGDIHVNNGLIRIMCSGRVEGNITCNELYIDGSVKGECKAETINIDEHGKISGTLTYNSLSIQHGATVIGALHHFDKSENLVNDTSIKAREVSVRDASTPELSLLKNKK